MLFLLLACTDPTDTGKPTDSPPADSEDSGDPTVYAPRTCATPEIPDDLPAASVDTEREHPFRTVTVPDTTLGTSGVLVYFPDPSVAGLWEDGAPVVVTASPAENTPEPYFKAELGLVEVQPLYPGDGEGELAAPGEYDGLGPNSAASVSAAIRFAAGLVASEEGWSVGQVAERTVCNGEVFVLAVSQGGAPTLKALADDADELGPYIGGIVSFESATLPQIMAGDVGKTFGDPDGDVDADANGYGWDDARNVDYGGCVGTTCVLDYSTIAFSSDYTPAYFFPPFYKLQELGILYLDRDGDGQLTTADGSTDVDGDGAVSADEDFPLISHQGAYEGDDVQRLYPTLEAIDAAIAAGVLDEASWPVALATRDQVATYWEPRTLNPHVPPHAAFPDHARYVSVYSEVDHGVPLPDRPHVTGLYADFQAQGWSVGYNDIAAGVSCSGVESLLADWPGAPPADTTLSQEELDANALPESIDAHAKGAAVLQLATEVFGPFDHCPEW